MEQPVNFGNFDGISQGIEGEGLEGKWPEFQYGIRQEAIPLPGSCDGRQITSRVYSS
jgi:hypothetical protein